MGRAIILEQWNSRRRQTPHVVRRSGRIEVEEESGEEHRICPECLSGGIHSALFLLPLLRKVNVHGGWMRKGAKGPRGLESKGPRRGHGSSKGPRGHREVQARGPRRGAKSAHIVRSR